MTRKHRMFDVELSEDAATAAKTFPAGKVDTAPPPTFPAGKVASGHEPRITEAQRREESDALAHVRLRRLGLIVELVPLEQIETYKLMRDRTKAADPELRELKASILALGLSNPIRAESRLDGHYELIQGYRRLNAYKELLAETGDTDRFAAIPTAVTAIGEDIESLYRQMVDENLVRKDISFAEMAQLAVYYAMDPQTPTSDPEKAVAELFKSASYQKRSYIRSFVKLVEVLGEDLQFAAEVPRALGLALVAQLEQDDMLAAVIRRELTPLDNRSVKEELEVLRRYAGTDWRAEAEGRLAAPPPAQRPLSGTDKAKTMFQFLRPEGPARCIAATGKIEIQLARDFSTIDRRRLEQAVRALLDHLN